MVRILWENAIPAGEFLLETRFAAGFFFVRIVPLFSWTYASCWVATRVYTHEHGGDLPGRFGLGVGGRRHPAPPKVSRVVVVRGQA
jgi:hypothetical protein